LQNTQKTIKKLKTSKNNKTTIARLEGDTKPFKKA